MRDSERYTAQADFVIRLAARAQSSAERQVFMNIADGWRRLADEAARHERRTQDRPAEPRSFGDRPEDD